MTYTQFFKLRPGAILLAGLISANGYAADDLSGESEEMVVLAPAEEQLKQQPGVSIITAEDIAKDPPVNDLSDIIRKMPGVNLTGNSASGSRGNNRQIDIRGMGPENTLILIDGVPTTSRNSVRYSWRGERDTRGDTNWVPAEMIQVCGAQTQHSSPYLTHFTAATKTRSACFMIWPPIRAHRRYTP
ncbi:Enterobactin outer-membrane receptor [Serratia quinivorans]|nr:Enterobactin outer-membrane receptor [Serratia quinivorans]